jgi:serine/threonine protein kinase/ankyrin repeat protein
VQGRIISADEFVAAATQGNIELVRQYLLQNQGNRDAVNVTSSDSTALYAAASNNHSGVVSLLIAHGADYSVESLWGLTPLEEAAASGHIDVVRILLQVDKSAFRAPENGKFSILTRAVQRNDKALVNFLLEAGVFVNHDELILIAENSKFHKINSILRKHRNKPAAAREAFSIIAFCSENNIDVQPQQLTQLSLRSLTGLHRYIINLKEKNILTQQSFEKALRFVSTKIPAVAESTLQKDHDKLANKKVHCLDGKFTFSMFSGASKFPNFEGGQGKLNKAYRPGEAHPSLIVKRLLPRDNTKQQCIEDAEHETRYLQKLSRTAYWYKTDNGAVIVTDYIEGDALFIEENGTFTAAFNFASYPPKVRLKWFFSGAKDIGIIHDSGHLYADVKPQNFVLNEKSGVMRLIDMGGCHKINSRRLHQCTPAYIEKNSIVPQKTAHDMYGLGLLLITMFPDLYHYEPASLDMVFGFIPMLRRTIITRIKTADLSPIEEAVVKLVDAMMNPVLENRCTINQVIAFGDVLTAVLDGHTALDEAGLQTALSKTINRSHFEVDDILHDCNRPALFAVAVAITADQDDQSPQSRRSMFTTASQLKKHKSDETAGQRSAPQGP